MIRTVMAAVGGYFTTAVLVMGFLIAATMIPDFVLRPGTVELTEKFLAYQIGTGLVSAALGARIAIMIAKENRRAAVLLLAAFVLILGYALAFSGQLSGSPVDVDPPPANVGSLSLAQRMQYVQSPMWFAWVIPIVGAVGTLLGGMPLRAPKPTGVVPTA